MVAAAIDTEFYSWTISRSAILGSCLVRVLAALAYDSTVTGLESCIVERDNPTNRKWKQQQNLQSLQRSLSRAV
eukprot:5990184-Amphidinium_carterae.1